MDFFSCFDLCGLGRVGMLAGYAMCLRGRGCIYVWPCYVCYVCWLVKSGGYREREEKDTVFPSAVVVDRPWGGLSAVWMYVCVGRFVRGEDVKRINVPVGRGN